MSNFIQTVGGIEKYRKNSEQVFTHIRKRCGCGKQVTEKQLTRYGKCVTCMKGETSVI